MNQPGYASCFSSILWLCAAELVGMPKCAGMVGVINRVTGTKTSLVQAAAEEQKVFQEKVLSKLAQQNGDRRNQILSNITIPNLILKIDQHFSKFIKDTWKPLALQQLTPKIANTEADIRRLGLPINRLTVPKVMAEILQQVRILYVSVNQISPVPPHVCFMFKYICTFCVLATVAT